MKKTSSYLSLTFQALLLSGVIILTRLPTYGFTDHINRSLELIQQGQLDAAEKEARFALSSPATAALAWAVLGALRLQQKNYEESSQFLAKAVRLNPRLLGAWLNLGSAYALQGKTERASEAFYKALKIDPGNGTAHFDLAKLEADRRNYGVSLEVAKPIITEMRHTDEGLLLLATDYLSLGQKESAQSLVTDWEGLTSIAQEVALKLGPLFVKNGLVQEAIKVLEKARSNGPDSFELDFDLAGCYLSAGDLKRASANYEASLAFRDDCIVCLRKIAEIAEREGDSDKALAYLIRAKRAEPENAAILFEFGKACLQRDLIEDALPVLQKAVELEPGNPSYTYVLASAYIAKKEFKTAGELLDSLLKQRPDDAVLNYARGALLFLEVNLVEAEKYLRKSISIDPNQLAAYYYLGLLDGKKGENGEAILIFRDLVKRFPSHAPSHQALGTALFRERKYTEAQEALEEAILLDPNSVASHYQLGMVLSRLGKQEESSKHLEIAQKLEADEKRKTNVELRILNPY